MKKIISVAIVFVTLSGVLQSAGWDKPKIAVPKVPLATRDNFVSLDMQTWGDIAGVQEQVRIYGNNISFTRTRPSPGGGRSGGFIPQNVPPPSMSALSENQLKELVRLLNETRFPALAGKYQQKNLNDGINEMVTLRLSDEKNVDRSFTVENYGATAPRNYYKVTAYLRRLQQQKFYPTAVATRIEPVRVTEHNFAALTLETSGGIANIRSLIEIRMSSDVSSIGGVTMNWSQTIGGRGMDRQATFSMQEMGELLRLLNAANLPNMNGKRYMQRELADGFNEVLTLIISGGGQFVVQNYGDKAPAAYYKVTEFLRQLQEKKFPSPQ